MINHSERVSEVMKWQHEVLELMSLNLTAKCRNYTSYLDVSVHGIRDLGDCSGIIPCRSMWDVDGRRLAAVLIFEAE
jgi:hypothetical protein